jgi:hypothetical protein
MPNQTHRAPPRYKIRGFFSILLGLQSTSFPGADVSGMTPVNYIHDAIKNAIKEKGLRDASLDAP